MYRYVVLDTYSRRVVGWSIDASPTAALVTNALGIAINSRAPQQDRDPFRPGVQFASWAITDRAKAWGLVPSMGGVGECYDSYLIESVWSRLQVELAVRTVTVPCAARALSGHAPGSGGSTHHPGRRSTDQILIRPSGALAWMRIGACAAR